MFPLFAFAALLFQGTAWAQKRPPIAENTAKEFGIDSFGQIEAIRYTFNLDFAYGKVSRTWIWEPKTGRVTYEGKDKSGQPMKVTYLRSELGSQSADVKDNIEPSFVNNRVQEFIYRRGGPKKPSIVIAAWTDYKKAGPLLVATDHRGTADGKPFRLTFSNVAVKLSGSDAWIEAH